MEAPPTVGEIHCGFTVGESGEKYRPQDKVYLAPGKVYHPSGKVHRASTQKMRLAESLKAISISNLQSLPYRSSINQSAPITYLSPDVRGRDGGTLYNVASLALTKNNHASPITALQEPQCQVKIKKVAVSQRQRIC